ncbi:hypothetical protein ZIOFF_007109 [Zingiber officinale]|uniref:Uncharacterized protein n=1 Tax=Zingiber officinale TaxID=94328 RepID=A0A8J5HT60_ZINOF|nr:hypothetical protein ZIOFF_007109 [Zingiber officinale]
MAAKAGDAPPVSAATPIDPPDPRPDSEARRVLEEERRIERNEEAADSEDCPRESKRRRTCPTALETAASSAVAAAAVEEEGQSSGAVRGEFSFFFDAKGQSPIETTPKFGTFRLGAVYSSAWFSFMISNPDTMGVTPMIPTTAEADITELLLGFRNPCAVILRKD